MTIFLAGAHGVGKTYLGRAIASHLSLQHVTASALIREERGRSTWTHDRRADDIDANQRALVAAVQRLVEDGNNLLLDGHFVLRDAAGDLAPLHRSVFAQLGLSGVLLIEVPVAVIAQRLADRPGTPPTDQEIGNLITAERDHAQSVCSEIGVPLVIMSSPTEEQLSQAITNLLTRTSIGGHR